MDDYRSSVLLPQTDFPMRGNLAERAKTFLNYWKQINLWRQLRKQSRGRDKFILHDGPPYANGHLHLGHALNKILKDMINRTRQMEGFDAHYVPGWDCHGLPIEWKVEEDMRSKGARKEDISVQQFRNKCRNFAEHWIDVQREEFQSIGLLGDWQNPYLTMNFRAEAQIAREIGKFLLQGSLYESARPVLWSIAEKTALADAEVEYQEHESPSIEVAFPLKKNSLPSGLPDNLHALIWTTTPWTIPANRAIAYKPDYSYVVARDPNSNKNFLIEYDCFEKNKKNRTRDSVVIEGKQLEGMVAEHPFSRLAKLREHYDFPVPLLPAEFVTRDQGTGLVHIAPSHGEEDFKLGKAHNIPCENTLDEEGRYTDKVAGFEGCRVYDEKGRAGEANARVLESLKQTECLLSSKTLRHQYPHSWRSKTPLVFRNTRQWFISMEVNDLRKKALNAIGRVDFFPSEGRQRLHDMIATRPDWCVSRQRLWGVPLPIFIDKKTREPLREQAVIDRVAEIFAEEGADSWFTRASQDFLPPPFKAEDYYQCQDVVDVWFDSGSTHAFVLEERGFDFPADLYLEGSDQHRGWFHSSLLQACGTRGTAPYKQVLTHGFALDEKGRKMSKSLGNIIAPQRVIERYGADILRLWVAASDTSDDMRIGETILRGHVDSYRRFRNTLRFLLGNLEANPAPPLPEDLSKLPYLECAVLEALATLEKELAKNSKEYDFTKYIHDLHKFCATTLSNFYFDVRKDCLYCDAKDSPQRLTCLSVMEVLFDFLSRRLAPILPFTAEEAFQSLQRKRGQNLKDSIHLKRFPDIPDERRDANPKRKRVDFLAATHNSIHKRLDELRKEGKIGSSLQALVSLPKHNHDVQELLRDSQIPEDIWEEVLTETLIVHKVEFADIDIVAIRRCEGEKCPRCWKYTQTSHIDKLCARCQDVVGVPLSVVA